MLPRIDNCRVEVNMYIFAEFDISIKSNHKGEYFPVPHVTLCDIRELLDDTVDSA